MAGTLPNKFATWLKLLPNKIVDRWCFIFRLEILDAESPPELPAANIRGRDEAVERFGDAVRAATGLAQRMSAAQVLMPS